MATPPPAPPVWAPFPPVPLRLLPGEACDAPWHLPVATLAAAQAAGSDPTADWPDFPVLVALRDLLGRVNNGPAVAWALESLGYGGASADGTVRVLAGAPGTSLELAWELAQAALTRTGHPALDLRRLDPDTQLPPGTTRSAGAGAGGILSRLEGDRFQPAHWLWQQPAARRLWTRATLELLVGQPIGTPLTGRRIKKPAHWPFAKPWAGPQWRGDGRVLLNAALLGSSGDGPLALQAGALLGPAGLLEVLDGAAHQIAAQTRSHPWAQNLFDAAAPALLSRAAQASWTQDQLRRGLMSTVREWRLTSAKAMAQHQAQRLPAGGGVEAGGTTASPSDAEERVAGMPRGRGRRPRKAP